MKRWLCAALALLMLLAAIPTVSAHGYSDIENHWAEAYIEEVTTMGLFHGTTDTTFSPESNITRGMFVTVLGRLEGIDPVQWCNESLPPLFRDVSASAYYAPYINWAVLNGVVDGVGDGRFSPDAQITREQMAKLLVCFGGLPGHSYAASEDELPDADGGASPASPIPYMDLDEISSWAVDFVQAAGELGLMIGSAREDGIYFRPKHSATRAEAAAVFSRMSHMITIDTDGIILPESVELEETFLELTVGEHGSLFASVAPEEAIYTTNFFWRSSDSSVCEVQYGLLTAKNPGTAVISVYTSNGLHASCTVQVNSIGLPTADESHYDKCMRVFGEYVENPNRYCYDMTREEALAMTELVTVPIWRIGSDGTKYSTTCNVRVHKNLAPAVKQIFQEIFEGEEQFPFHAVSGWTWREHGTSEHYCGCALDLNPNENPYVSANGTILVGSHFKPGEDPYSIPIGGEVDRIFAKYGFTRGINWRNGTKDYMHYSFFGT